MPLGLLALGSWLEGRHVVIVDGRFELAPEARVVELARSALLLGVCARTGEPLREALRVSRAARAASPRLPVVWGGPHVLLDPDSCFESGVVDGCVPGAGEEALQAAVAALRSGRPLALAPGLRVAGVGEAVAPAPPPTRLWPRADYSLLDVERYFEERGARRLDYCSSRGGRDAPDWLGLRPERVVGEVMELAERYRLGELCFLDEDFFADAGRVEAIAERAGRRWRPAQLARRSAARGRARGGARRAAAARAERLPRAADPRRGRRARAAARDGGADCAAAGLGGTLRVRGGRGGPPGELAAAVSAARAAVRDGQPLRDADPAAAGARGRTPSRAARSRPGRRSRRRPGRTRARSGGFRAWRSTLPRRSARRGGASASTCCGCCRCCACGSGSSRSTSSGLRSSWRRSCGRGGPGPRPAIERRRRAIIRALRWHRD